jgi:hypothetical protein
MVKDRPGDGDDARWRLGTGATPTPVTPPHPVDRGSTAANRGQPRTDPADNEKVKEREADDRTRAVPRVAPPHLRPPHLRPPSPRTPSQQGGTAVWPTATQPTQRMDAAIAEPVVVRAARRSRPPAWQIALLSLVALGAIGAAIVVGTRSLRTEQDGTGGVATATPNAKHPPQKDVALDGCKLDATGVTADGTVRNPTDERADYVIEVHLLDPSAVVITTGRAHAVGVEPGATTTWSATLPPVPSNAPSATCKLVQVDRYRA